MTTLPILPGYTWRSLEPGDKAALEQLERACMQADGATNEAVLTDYAGKMQRLVPADTLGAVNANGEIAASAWVLFEGLKHEYRAFLGGLVGPAWRGQGIGEAILGWMEGHSRRFFATVADDRPRVLRHDFYQRGPEALALLERNGFQFVFAEDEMVRDLKGLAEHALPAGLRSVAWSPERGRDFHHVYTEAFRERPGFPDWPEDVWIQNLTGYDEFRADLSRLVLDGDEPVGYAVCAVEEGVGEIVQIAVGPRWRGRGVASGILSDVFRQFRQEGLTRASLSVNVNNPSAISVYRRLGFELFRRYTSYRKSL